jgi:hypothetical protein
MVTRVTLLLRRSRGAGCAPPPGSPPRISYFLPLRSASSCGSAHASRSRRSSSSRARRAMTASCCFSCDQSPSLSTSTRPSRSTSARRSGARWACSSETNCTVRPVACRRRSPRAAKAKCESSRKRTRRSRSLSGRSSPRATLPNNTPAAPSAACGVPEGATEAAAQRDLGGKCLRKIRRQLIEVVVDQDFALPATGDARSG